MAFNFSRDHKADSVRLLKQLQSILSVHNPRQFGDNGKLTVILFNSVQDLLETAKDDLLLSAEELQEKKLNDLKFSASEIFDNLYKNLKAAEKDAVGWFPDKKAKAFFDELLSLFGVQKLSDLSTSFMKDVFKRTEACLKAEADGTEVVVGTLRDLVEKTNMQQQKVGELLEKEKIRAAQATERAETAEQNFGAVRTALLALPPAVQGQLATYLADSQAGKLLALEAAPGTVPQASTSTAPASAHFGTPAATARLQDENEAKQKAQKSFGKWYGQPRVALMDELVQIAKGQKTLGQGLNPGSVQSLAKYLLFKLCQFAHEKTAHQIITEALENNSDLQAAVMTHLTDLLTADNQVPAVYKSLRDAQGSASLQNSVDQYEDSDPIFTQCHRMRAMQSVILTQQFSSTRIYLPDDEVAREYFDFVRQALNDPAFRNAPDFAEKFAANETKYDQAAQAMIADIHIQPVVSMK